MPEVTYARYSDGAAACVAAAVAGAFVATQTINFLAPLPQDLMYFHARFWAQGLLKFALNYETSGWRMYSNYLTQYSHTATPYLIKWRMATVASVSAGAGLWAGWSAGKPISDLDKISGNALLHGRAAIDYFNKRSDESGLKLSNGMTLDVNKETEHVLIAGGTGAGKSVTAMSILKPALERYDRIILINYKGLVEKFPCTLNTENKENGDAIILCPFDRRSAVWAVWRDVTTKSQAREYAARVIPESKDPVWSNSARFIMTGCLLSLINNFSSKGEAWSWKQFADLCVLDRDSLVEILAEHYPEGLRSIKEEGKTSESVLMNFAAFAAPIIDLADAWCDRKTGFSIESWVNNPNSKIRTIILQLSSEFKVLSQTFNQSILNQVGTYLTRLPDVPANKNAIWLYADEFPRLGKSEVFEELFSVGRSKSFRVVVAIQDLGQLKSIYGIDISEGWVSSIGTKILGRSSATGAKWTSEMCGQAIYAQLQSGREVDSKRRIAYGSPQTFDVFPPESVQNELGIFYSPIKTILIDLLRTFWLKNLIKKIGASGVRMLVHGVKGAVLLVDFKFTILPKVRKETELATWAKGGFGTAENTKIEEIMQPNITPALPLIFDEQAGECDVTLSRERNSEVFTVAETTFIHEQKALEPAPVLESEKTGTDELLKELDGEILDQITGVDNLSAGLEILEVLTEEKPTESVSFEETATTNQNQNTTKKKPRYVSRKARGNERAI